MKMLITKVCQGIIDTDQERRRISKAFRNDPETRQHLTLLMDAIEAGDWKKAQKTLDSKWWEGRDKKQECPRQEFIGLLNVANPKKPGHPASGFDHWSNYAHLVYVMSHNQKMGGNRYTATPVVGSGA